MNTKRPNDTTQVFHDLEQVIVTFIKAWKNEANENCKLQNPLHKIAKKDTWLSSKDMFLPSFCKFWTSLIMLKW